MFYSAPYLSVGRFFYDKLVTQLNRSLGKQGIALVHIS
jgi:hypothetical protein